MIDLDGACYGDGSDPVQAAADGAAALRAIGGAAKDAGFDSAAKIGGIIGGHSGEDAVAGIFRGMEEGVGDAFVEEELGIALGEGWQLAGEGGAMFGG